MMEYKKVASRIGWGLAAFFVVGQLSSIILNAIMMNIYPTFVKTLLGNLLLTDIGLYGIGLPVLVLICKGLPNADPQIPKQQKPATLGLILKIFCMSVGATYIVNIIYLLITTALSSITGESFSQDVVQNAIDQGNLWEKALVFCIIAPILEELVFRKYLYKKIGAYGDNVFIFVSGLCFGLFHGNLHQFLYTSILGALWAWLYVVTGNVVWPMLMHMLTNFMGSILMSIISEIEILSIFVGLFPIVMVIVAIVLFIRAKRHNEFAVNPERKAEKGWLKETILNAGMMVHILVFLSISMLLIFK